MTSSVLVIRYNILLYIYIVYTSILSHSTIWIVLSSYIFCVSWINIPNNGKFVLLFGRYISYINIYNFTSTLYIVNRRVIKCLARSIYGKRKKKIKRVSRVYLHFLFSHQFRLWYAKRISNIEEIFIQPSGYLLLIGIPRFQLRFLEHSELYIHI